MYDHIGLKVKDLDTAVRFYEAAWVRSDTSSVRARRPTRGSGPGMNPGCGSTVRKAAPVPVCTWRFGRRIARPWIGSTVTVWLPAARTTASPGCDPTTARRTTRRS